jgi:hypothetical protein
MLATQGMAVRDQGGSRIGKVDDLFIAGDRQARYLAVRLGLLGTKITIVPVQLVTSIDREDNVVTVSVRGDAAKSGPAFDRDHEFTAEDEAEIRHHCALGELASVVSELLPWEEAS